MGKLKENDFLRECAIAASKKGISYGKYMAQRYNAGLRRNPHTNPEPDPEPDAVCKSCGKPFVKSARYRVYCCEACKCNGELQIKRQKYSEKSGVKYEQTQPEQGVRE